MIKVSFQSRSAQTSNGWTKAEYADLTNVQECQRLIRQSDCATFWLEEGANFADGNTVANETKQILGWTGNISTLTRKETGEVLGYRIYKEPMVSYDVEEALQHFHNIMRK